MFDDKRPFGLWLARIGLLVGILSLFDFSANVLRFESWSTFSKFAVFTSIVNTLVLMPVWLIMLSLELPAAKPKCMDDEGEEEPFVQSANQNLHPRARHDTMPIT